MHKEKAQTDIVHMLSGKELSSEQQANLRKRVRNFCKPFGLANVFAELHRPIPPKLEGQAYGGKSEGKGGDSFSRDFILYSPDYSSDKVSAVRMLTIYERVSENPSAFVWLDLIKKSNVQVTIIRCGDIEDDKPTKIQGGIRFTYPDADGAADMVSTAIGFCGADLNIYERYIKFEGKWYHSPSESLLETKEKNVQ